MDLFAKGSNHVPFSVNGFYSYSRKRKRVGHKLEIKSQKYAQEFLPKKFSPRLFGPSDTWKVFFKQADAFAFVHKARLNLHVFAFESESNKTDQQGVRMYLAATYPVFWHYYSQLDEAHRHHYEIIPEGSVCKLYFDLEFYREFNPELEDGYDLCRIFIKYVCAWLKEIFSLDCNEQHVLILDASTATKYSEHLIFLLPNAAFKDNYQVGSFVQFISTCLVRWLKETTVDEENKNHVSFKQNVADPLSTEGTEMIGEADIGTSSQRKNDTKVLLEYSAEFENRTPQKYQAEKIFSLFSKEMLRKLIVRDKNGHEMLLCDLGVYTKNRNFRLFLSRKLGQKNPFLVSHHNKFSPASKEDQTMFLESLIANVQNGADLKILIFEQKNQMRLRMRNLQIKSPDFSAQEGDSSELSPYPEVDAFINSLVSSNGRHGKIRHWFYFMEGNLLGYDIVGYRWCGNINRQHKSNNIRLFVDLKKCVYYQKCHDPVCKQADYCSDYCDLPPRVLPWLAELSMTETNEDLMYNELDDNSLADAVEHIEQSRQTLELEDDELISATETQ